MHSACEGQIEVLRLTGQKPSRARYPLRQDRARPDLILQQDRALPHPGAFGVECETVGLADEVAGVTLQFRGFGGKGARWLAAGGVICADSSVLPHWATMRMKSFGAVSGLGPLRVTCTVWRLLTTAVTVWAAAAALHALRLGEVSIR